MAYTTMKKLIKNANAKLANHIWSQEEYDSYKETQQRKLDVFYGNGRLTEAQYEELTGMWVDNDD